MTNNKQVNFLIKIGTITAFAALAFVGTTVIKIPIPATGGYFNLGDTFVMAAALLFGPVVGGLVGFIGPAASDALGFPQFIIATAVVKGLEGFAIGLLAGKEGKILRIVLSLIIGVIILVGGYFLFEAFIYPPLGKIMPFFAVTDVNAAIAELLPNLLQGTLSAILSFALWKVFRGLRK